MKRPLAYITAAWLGGDSEKAELAAQYCRTVYEAGFSPICPPLYLPLFLNDAVPEEHKSGIDMSRDLLRRSHVPDQVKPYFDYEAYGRDACIHENGHFAPGGYVVKESDHFVEVYHGLQDIPKEHKVFSFPKFSIREQMAAYQEIIDGSSLEGYRQMQKKDRGDR